MKIQPIETERLLLRGFTKEDALWAFHIWNDPEMGLFLPDETMEEADPDYIRELEELGDDPDCCYLIPVLKESNQRIGTCSFIEENGVFDLAYCVHKDFWNQGYATEMARGMLDYARKQGAKKATIDVSKDNIASKRVAEKCGGHIVSEKEYRKRGSDQSMTEYRYGVAL